MNLLLTEYEERNVAGFEIDKCEEKKSLKNVCVITNGCPENRIDCSRTQQFLSDNGYTVTADVQDGNLQFILNPAVKFKYFFNRKSVI